MSNRMNKKKRTKQLNGNAYEQKKINVTSRLETIGKLIIDRLKGSKRNYLKKRLSIFHVTQNHSSLKTSLQEILHHFHTLNSYHQREYRTIGIGDEIVNISDVTTDVENSLKVKEKKISNIPTRTVCTRSFKLKNLNEDYSQKTDDMINKQSSFSKPTGENATAIKTSPTKKFRLSIPC